MAKDHDPLPMPDLASLVAKHDSEIAAIRSDIGDVKSGLSKIFDRMESMHRENTGRISSLEQRSSGLEQKASSKGTFSLPVVVAFTGGLLTLLLGVLATAAGAVV